MNTAKTAVLLTLLVLTSSCASHRLFSDADQRVVEAVAGRICEKSIKGYFFLSPSTAVVDSKSVVADLDASATKSLIERNAQAVELPPVRECPGLRRATQAQIDEYLPSHANEDRADTWARFYETHANAKGIMTLSLPGYSEAGDIALVQVMGVCGELCGSGFVWVMRNEGGRWRFDKAVQGWTN